MLDLSAMLPTYNQLPAGEGGGDQTAMQKGLVDWILDAVGSMPHGPDLSAMLPAYDQLPAGEAGVVVIVVNWGSGNLLAVFVWVDVGGVLLSGDSPEAAASVAGSEGEGSAGSNSHAPDLSAMLPTYDQLPAGEGEGDHQTLQKGKIYTDPGR
jgi:hypothetical protein